MEDGGAPSGWHPATAYSTRPPPGSTRPRPGFNRHMVPMVRRTSSDGSFPRRCLFLVVNPVPTANRFFVIGVTTGACAAAPVVFAMLCRHQVWPMPIQPGAIDILRNARKNSPWKCTGGTPVNVLPHRYLYGAVYASHRYGPAYAFPQIWACLCLPTDMDLSMPPHRYGPAYASPQIWACLCLPQIWTCLCLPTDMGLSMPPHRYGPVYASPQI